jgi:NACalpha-BTF3-like transcription factor
MLSLNPNADVVVGGSGGGHNIGGHGGDQGDEPDLAAISAPQEGDIDMLTSLGFPREDAIAALQATGNNVERAADRLLNA